MVFTKVRPQVYRPPAGGGALGRAVRGLLLGVGLLLRERAAQATTDPALAAVQRAALAHAGLSEGATTRLLARHHLSALLPQVRFTIGRGWQLSATGRALDGLTAPTVDDDHTSYAVSASWDLARLLVPKEAMQLHQGAPRRAQLRLALLVRVAGLLSARCRLLQAAAGPAGAAQRVAELEAALDLLTGDYPLPAVTPEASCPAVPRLKVGPARSGPGPHRPSGRRTPAAGELGDDSDEDGLPDAGTAELPDFGYE